MATLIQTLTIADFFVQNTLISEARLSTTLTLGNPPGASRVFVTNEVPAGKYFHIVKQFNNHVVGYPAFMFSEEKSENAVLTNENTGFVNFIETTNSGYLYIIVNSQINVFVIEIYKMDDTDGVISLDEVKHTIDATLLPANTAGGATMTMVKDRIKQMF